MNGDDRQSKIDDLDITQQELDSIGKALKNEEFRKLLCEYMDEINDPENQAQYEREIEEYERERGTEVTFVRPQPGYVLKTCANGSQKVFINICVSDVLQKPVCRPGSEGGHWSLPHCLSPVREDYDKARKLCNVYDAIFHPDVLELIKHSKSFKNMVEDTALIMIEKNNNVVLDKINVKYPKISFKGISRPLVIRKPIKDFQPTTEKQTELPGCPYKPPVNQPIQHHDLGTLKQKSLFTVPKHVIKYRSDIDIQEHAYNMHCKMNAVIPKELVVEIYLPLLDSSSNVKLDVLPRSLKLVCYKPSKYKLDINLPYSVLENEGKATFDQSTKKLIVSLPVLRTEPQLEYVKHLVSEVEESKNLNKSFDSDIVNGHSEIIQNENKINDQKCNTINSNEVIITNNHYDESTNDECNTNNNNANCITSNNVHYLLPEHEFIYGSKCILTFNVKNVDPTSINVIVINDKNLISSKFHSIGSGFFPIWFAFCIQIPSQSSLIKADVKVLPSDKNIILEFFINFNSDCKQYFYGLDEDNLIAQSIKVEALKENSKDLANGVSVSLSDSDDGDDDDVFDNIKEIGSKNEKQQNTKKNDTYCKDKNGKTVSKDKGKKKRGKKIQKSNAIPIITASSLPESGKKEDFMPGSLPVDFNSTRPVIRGILKKRTMSECSNLDDSILSPRIYSSSIDNVDTESSEVLESSFNDLSNKKTVRFNDHVIEKKINFNLSIAAQAKKHRQRQQRKRNIREYSTPSESEASEAEDRTYGLLNMVSESEETSVSESSAGEMSDDNGNEPKKVLSTTTIVADSKKDHKRRKSKSARKNASLAKQTSMNSLIFPIEY